MPAHRVFVSIAMIPRSNLILPSYRITSITISRSCKASRLPVSAASVDVPCRDHLQIVLENARKLDFLRSSDTCSLRNDIIQRTFMPVYSVDVLRQKREEYVCRRLTSLDSLGYAPVSVQSSSGLGMGPGTHQLQYKTDKRLEVSKEADLPSSGQLDEMMWHFQDQASNLFTSGWTYSKCSYRIEFHNKILGTCTHTLNSYIFQINAMRNISRIALINPELSIVAMTKNVDDGTIHVRWQLQGMPRYLVPFKILGALHDERQFLKYIDGFSIFYIGSDGLYHKHILSKMVPRKNRERRSFVTMFFSRFGVLSRLGGDIQKEPVFPTVVK